MTLTIDEESPNKGKTLNQMIQEASAQVTFKNMQKLCNQDEYIIAGEKYKRVVLNPDQIVELNKLQKIIDETDDPKVRMEKVKQQAELCLEGVTDAKWKKTDAARMELVIGACLLISKGFCDY